MDLRLADELGVPHAGMPGLPGQEALAEPPSASAAPAPAPPHASWDSVDRRRSYEPVPRHRLLRLRDETRVRVTQSAVHSSGREPESEPLSAVVLEDAAAIRNRNRWIIVLLCVVILLGGAIGVIVALHRGR